MITFVSNLETMKERIQTIIDHYRLTAARFADKIGVQRSAVSHILSGRNNPGYDFMVKILETYPDINGDWLLIGQGDMHKKKSGKPILSPTLFSTQPDTPIPSSTPPSTSNTIDSIEIQDHPPAEYTTKQQNQSKNEEKTPQNTEKQIDKIVIFYTDHTFEAYRP